MVIMLNVTNDTYDVHSILGCLLKTPMWLSDHAGDRGKKAIGGKAQIKQTKKKGKPRKVYCSEIKKHVYLLRDPHIESLPAGFSGFPGHGYAPHQKSQKLFRQSCSRYCWLLFC